MLNQICIKPRLSTEFEQDAEPVSQVRWSLDAERHRIRQRLIALRSMLQDQSLPFERAAAMVALEELVFEVESEFAEEEMLMMKHGEEACHGHRCSHEALASAMHATQRAVMRCRAREDLSVAVEAIGDWLLNHFDTVDARDQALLQPVRQR